MRLDPEYSSCDLIECYQYSLRVKPLTGLEPLKYLLSHGNSFIGRGVECGAKIIGDEIVINAFSRDLETLVNDLEDRVCKDVLTNPVERLCNNLIEGQEHDLTGLLKRTIEQSVSECLVDRKIRVGESLAGGTIILLSNHKTRDFLRAVKRVCARADRVSELTALPFSPHGYTVIHSEYNPVPVRRYKARLDNTVFKDYDNGAEIVVNGSYHGIVSTIAEIIGESWYTGVIDCLRMPSSDKAADSDFRLESWTQFVAID